MVEISRRAFIAASSAFAGALALPGLLQAQELKELPSLQAQVDSGALPPVADRLPVNPLVITPTERLIGVARVDAKIYRHFDGLVELRLGRCS